MKKPIFIIKNIFTTIFSTIKESFYAKCFLENRKKYFYYNYI